MVAPFHDPIHLAEQIAMADALSGGRFDAGFGRGYQAHEFAGFGISMDEASARYKECVTIVEGLLGKENGSATRASTGRSRTSRCTRAPCSSPSRSGAR